MASQQETLNLAAQVVDGFSQPLRDMTRKLREFGDFGKTVSREGRRDTGLHNQAWRDLRKTMLDSSTDMRRIITPAISALGIGTSGAALSLAEPRSP